MWLVEAYSCRGCGFQWTPEMADATGRGEMTARVGPFPDGRDNAPPPEEDDPWSEVPSGCLGVYGWE